jgi:integral membrane protein
MAESSTESSSTTLARLRRMRLAVWLEGLTLVILVFIAVPLKYAMGYPVATRIMGPIHGAAFLIYIGILIDTVTIARWNRREIAGVVAAAFVPFGAVLTLRMLRRKQSALHPPRLATS